MVSREVGPAEQQIQARRAQRAGTYARAWARMLGEWGADAAGDRAWLTYAASYLLRTGGVHWAIDPFTLAARIPGAPPVEVSALRRLDFALLTHRHNDHLDLGLIRALRDAPITWVIPDFLQPAVIDAAALPRERVITPRAGQPLELNGVRIMPFEGLHYEYGADGAPVRGVPALGYLAERGGRRWLFPGDTRTYDAMRLPAFGAVDVLFAHLWLGRGAALLPQPPLLDAFCRFCLDLRPARVVLTHLNELGRPAAECWDESHAALALARLQVLSPGLAVEPRQMGESVDLS